MISKEFLAYAAGFFDGEGCVTLAKSRGKTAIGTPYHYYSIRTTVAQVNRDVLDLFKAEWGGSVYCQDEEYRRRPLYVWKLGNKKCLPYLESIRPYSIVKAAQIDIALRLQSLGYGQRNAVGEDLRRQMWELNGKHGLHEFAHEDVQ